MFSQLKISLLGAHEMPLSIRQFKAALPLTAFGSFKEAHQIMVNTDYISSLGCTRFKEKLVKILQASVFLWDACSLTSDRGLVDRKICRVTRQI